MFKLPILPIPHHSIDHVETSWIVSTVTEVPGLFTARPGLIEALLFSNGCNSVVVCAGMYGKDIRLSPGIDGIGGMLWPTGITGIGGKAFRAMFLTGGTPPLVWLGKILCK